MRLALAGSGLPSEQFGKMMRLGVFGDVHANLAACKTALDFLDSLALDMCVCLGDSVGYNAEPTEALAMLRSRAPRIVAGNHDRTVAGAPVPGLMSANISRTHQWTRERLSEDDLGYLRELPNILLRDEFCAVHGCYLNPDHFYGYITGSMVDENLHAIAANGAWPKVAFCGHTHCPSICWLVGGEVTERDLVERVVWPENAASVIINPGSVGQPRDKDPRAAVAVVDFTTREVIPHRLEYDVRRTQHALAAAGFSEELATRLEKGV